MYLLAARCRRAGNCVEERKAETGEEVGEDAKYPSVVVANNAKISSTNHKLLQDSWDVTCEYFRNSTIPFRIDIWENYQVLPGFSNWLARLNIVQGEGSFKRRRTRTHPAPNSSWSPGQDLHALLLRTGHALLRAHDCCTPTDRHAYPLTLAKPTIHTTPNSITRTHTWTHAKQPGVVWWCIVWGQWSYQDLSPTNTPPLDFGDTVSLVIWTATEVTWVCRWRFSIRGRSFAATALA